MRNPDSLLARVLKEKYYPKHSFLEAKKGWRSSWGWKNILQGQKVLESGLRWRVGDGRNIRIRNEPWIPKLHTFHVQSRHENMPVMVGGLIDHSTGSWKRNLVRNYLDVDEAKLILWLPISLYVWMPG